MSTTCGRGKKEHLFTEQLPLADFRYSVYFLLELKKVDVRLKNKKMKFYKETMKKTLIILYRTKNKQQLVILRQQENPPHLRALQVKVEYRKKNSSSCSTEWTYNQIIELIDTWKEEEAQYNIRYPVRSINQDINNDAKQYSFLSFINHQLHIYIYLYLYIYIYISIYLYIYIYVYIHT